MKFIDRLQMLLVYTPNIEDPSKSKILKISDGVTTSVFLDGFRGNSIQMETIEVDNGEINMILNNQENGLRVLYGLNEVGAYKDVFYWIEGKNFFLFFKEGVKSHKIFGAQNILVLDKKNRLFVYSLASLAGDKKLGVFPYFSLKENWEIEKIRFSKKCKNFTLVEKSPEGVFVDVMAYEKVKEYSRIEDSIKISIIKRIKFSLGNIMDETVFTYANLDLGYLCLLGNDKIMRFYNCSDYEEEKEIENETLKDYEFLDGVELFNSKSHNSREFYAVCGDSLHLIVV